MGCASEANGNSVSSVPFAMTPRRRLGEILMDAGVLTEAELEHAMLLQRGKRQIAPTFNGWGLLCMLRCYRVVLQVSGNDVEYGSKFSIAAGSSISMFGIFSNT